MVCPRSGAHSSSGFSLCEGMVIDQRFRTKICVNIKTNQAAVEAGVLLGPLSAELGKLGLALPSGSCPNNGSCGLTLGGGIGFLTRKFGVTSDSLLELRTILANGEMVTANNVENEDFYEAMRPFSLRVHMHMLILSIVIFQIFSMHTMDLIQTD